MPASEATGVEIRTEGVDGTRLLPVFAARPSTTAHLIAGFIVRQGIDRIFSLPGGHMKPIWDELTYAGVRIVVARHECAAVHMAQADADLTGRLAVAIVTTGPGLTNSITGIACAYLARSPILVISTRVPQPQEGMGALEEVPQVELVRPVCRYAHEVRDVRHVLIGLHAAASAAVGNDGPAGPTYVDFSTDLLRLKVPRPYADLEAVLPSVPTPMPPDSTTVEKAASQIRVSRRLLVLSGRGAVGHGALVERFLEASQALYLDTRESRGAVSLDHLAYVPAMRAQVLTSADLVITLGRRLDFEVAYGSAAVFSPEAKFIRIGRSSEEVSANRLGDLELRGDVDRCLEALLAMRPRSDRLDQAWVEEMKSLNAGKVARMRPAMETAPSGADGRMHPRRLLTAVNRVVDDKTIGIVDGGDILSFARIGFQARTYLDLGAFGCLGVGVPFAVAAALRHPDRRVIALIGDGAFGFNGMEVETAVREKARVLLVIANNSAWNIERYDQIANYGGRVIGTELSECSYSLVAKGLGAYAERIENVEDLDAALARALENLPAVVEVLVTRDAVSSDTKSGLAQVPDYQAVKQWDQAERGLWDRESGGEPMPVVIHGVEGRPRPRGYSEATSSAGIVCISGQLAAEDVLAGASSFADQFKSAIRRFMEVAAAAGSNTDDVLLLRIYVTDMHAYHAAARDFGPAYKEALGGQYPATTLVQVTGLVDPRAMVEIEGLTVRGDQA
jgi:acetolactate synthase-1/2/3 large subunit